MKQSTETILALIQKDISNIKNDVSEIKEHLEANYITKVEFKPVKNIVYGAVGLALSSVFLGILALIIKK